MNAAREVRCSRTVDCPYDRVARLLTRDAVGLFERATAAEPAPNHEMETRLMLPLAGGEIELDLRVGVVRVDADGRPPGAPVLPATEVDVHLGPGEHLPPFPIMNAEITVYPLSDRETQIDLHGRYTPPGGLVGEAADSLVGHRIVEASVKRFFDEIVERVRVDACGAPAHASQRGVNAHRRAGRRRAPRSTRRAGRGAFRA